MQPHQERVVVEKKELDEKLQKLYAFFQGTIIDGLDQAERDRLKRQAEAMQAYSDILGERVAAFT